MMVIKGTGVYGGIAIGKLVLLKRQNKKIERHVIEDVNIE